MTKIDFVLPWVDPNDINWQKSKHQHSGSVMGEHNSVARYRDMNTLKFVLRSIEKNCPWYNKIHLITCGHYPEWLNIEHPKINLVTHEQLYFDKSHLPVFSSSSIEMNLANMKNITEQFVYLNDDMVIMNKVEIERFFQQGKPVDFLSHGWLSRNKFLAKLRGMDTWVHSLNNNLALINNKFSPLKFESKYLYHSTYNFTNKLSNFLLQNIYKKIIWIEHWHHPQPYLMSTLKGVYSEFNKDMMTCSANKFRANNDLTQYLYRYWDLAHQYFVPYKHNDGLAENIISEKYFHEVINKIRPDINFICLNDSDKLSNLEFENIKQLLKTFLESKLPDKACFEN